MDLQASNRHGPEGTKLELPGAVRASSTKNPSSLSLEAASCSPCCTSCVLIPIHHVVLPVHHHHVLIFPVTQAPSEASACSAQWQQTTHAACS